MKQCCTKGLFWPVVAIMLGVVILMINMGYLPAGIARYWPILPVIWGLVKISENEEGKKGK